MNLSCFDVVYREWIVDVCLVAETKLIDQAYHKIHAMYFCAHFGEY